jgi:hypothetical protein
MSSIPAGYATHLILEVLHSVMSPERAASVLEAAGWDMAADRPSDSEVSITDFVLGDLYLRCLETIGNDAAGELRTALVALLPRAQRGSTHQSGVRMRRRPATTLVPMSSDSALVISSDPSLPASLAKRIHAANIIVTSDAIAIAAELADASATLVVLDRRGRRDTDDLRALTPDLFADRTVVLWGSRPADAPDLERILCECARRIDCGIDTTSDDIAVLCLTQLQPVGARRTA